MTGTATPPLGSLRMPHPVKQWLMQPVNGAMFVGTLALLGSFFLINTTFPLMGQEIPSSSYICSVLGSYGIGSPVTWYCLRQNRELKQVLAELERIHALLAARSRLDAMTGLLNREAFLQAADRAIETERPAALLIGDIDNFKQINDTWGHLAGDRAIELVAGAMQSVAGPDIRVGRIGGEEFAILLEGTHAEDAAAIAEAMRQSIEVLDFCPVDGMRQPLTMSIGGAACRKGAIATDIVRRADRCLYAAKNSGRNRTVFDRAA